MSGLAGWFDQVLVSAEVGRAKSDPDFAEALRRMLAIEHREVCLVVGDSAERDLRLAAAGGWPAVRLCGAAPCAVPGAVSHVADLSGLQHSCRCE